MRVYVFMSPKLRSYRSGAVGVIGSTENPIVAPAGLGAAAEHVAHWLLMLYQETYITIYTESPPQTECFYSPGNLRLLMGYICGLCRLSLYYLLII